MLAIKKNGLKSRHNYPKINIVQFVNFINEKI